MGAFNRLRAEVRCPNCGNTSEQMLQFKFGDTWQYDYELDDKLRWGGNDIGRPGLAKVIVSAVGEGCRVCHSSEDFSIEIEGDVLTAVEDAPEGAPPMTDGELFAVIETGE